MNGYDRIMHIYSDALRTAQINQQVVGEKSEYYVTIQQLERLMRIYFGADVKPT